VVVAARTSNRVPRDGIPIATKAANRARARDTITGNSSTSNPFTLLNNTDKADLEKVMLDLDIETKNVGEQIDIFRVEELARAALVEANYKVFLEKQKGKQDSLSSNQMDDLTMEVFDNKGRGVMSKPNKRGLVSLDSCDGSELSRDLVQNEVHVLEC
jgi:hypothetical protein